MSMDAPAEVVNCGGSARHEAGAAQDAGACPSIRRAMTTANIDEAPRCGATISFQPVDRSTGEKGRHAEFRALSRPPRLSAKALEITLFRAVPKKNPQR